jgi:P22 coat protein - gene protein 5
MTQRVLTAAVIAKEAIMWLENELVMANLCHRAHEEEFQKSVNGYKPGATVSIRKPAQFVVRNGAVASSQEVNEGQTSITIDTQKGVDFEFTSADLTLKIDELGERVIKPAMSTLANDIDADLQSMAAEVYNWVGTPGEIVNSFSDFTKAPERLDEMAVPKAGRSAILSPSDHYGLVNNFTGLPTQSGAAKSALEEASLPKIAGVQPYSSQNVLTFVTGARGGAPLVNGGAQAVNYDTVKDTGVQTLVTDGWTAAVAPRVVKGDVFTIAGVYAVNPRTRARLPFLQQFVVTANGSSDVAGNLTMTISPAIITSGAFQTVDSVPADNAPITFLGAASTGYRQNLVFHKNAFALAMAPMIKPEGAVKCSRQTYKGISVRVIPFYDGTNDVSKWRLDVLYGKKALDPRLAARLSGTA